MKTNLPGLSDFRFAGNSEEQLQGYFENLATKPFLGICLVVSPDADLRVDLAYALLGRFTEGGVGGDLDGGGVSTLEARSSYQLPESICMQQAVYGSESEKVAACTRLLRSAPDYILIDDLGSVEMAKRALECSFAGMRVIAGVAAASQEKGRELFASFPAPVLDVAKIDLVIWAPSREPVQVEEA